MRKLLLFISLIFAGATAHGQDNYNFTNWGIGFFGSLNQPYVDVKKANQGKTFDIVGYYNLTPYVPLGLELQAGELSGGSIVTDPSKRQFDNQYKAVLVHGDYALGEILDYEGSFLGGMIKDFYVGTGIGVIANHMKFIQRYNLVAYQYPIGTYRYPGKDNSLSLVVPIRFGYEFKIYNLGEPFIGINIQYIHNITFNEQLDGYKDPPSTFKNNSPDQFRQIQVGIKVNFGQSIPYTKRINE